MIILLKLIIAYHLIISNTLYCKELSGYDNYTDPIRPLQRQRLSQSDQLGPINAKRLLFVTHASTEWDFDKSAEKPIVDVLQFFLKENEKIADSFNKAPSNQVLYFIDDWNSIENYYWRNLSFPNIYEITSYGGRHSIEIADVSEIYVTGGIFNYCSCRSILDAISHHYAKYKTELHFYFILDALYHNKLLVSSEYSTISLDGLGDTISLKDVFLGLSSDEEKSNFIQVTYFTNGFMCKATSDTNISQENYMFKLYLGNQKPIGSVGASNKPIVHFHFITLEDYAKMIRGDKV